mgnify:CR=1 FL=1|tara:strand:- start:5496 stop:5630 length:135 start_codon:yes stop_codon:yes gene_type:complete
MIAYDDSIFNYLVPTYFTVDMYEIVIVQDSHGNALTIKINYNGE